MSGFLQIIVEGNLGNDPQMSEYNGQAVANFSVAVNVTFPSREEGKPPIEQVTWVRVNVWGKQAEAVGKYLAKGREVLVIGRLVPERNGPGAGSPRIWQDPNDGTMRTSYEVRAQPGGVVFVGGPTSGDGNGSQYAPPENAAEEDEIPF